MKKVGNGGSRAGNKEVETRAIIDFGDDPFF